MKLENIMIGNTRLGSWNKFMNKPENAWCRIVWNFNIIVFSTIIILEMCVYNGT